MWKLLLVVSILAVVSYRADYQRYSIFDTGTFKRLERAPSDSGVSCQYCENSVSNGEKRIWFKETVCCGIVLLRHGKGVNHYCEEHVSFEFSQRDESEDYGRVITTVAGILSGLEHAEGFEPEPEDSEFAKVTNTTGTLTSAFSLLPILMLVLFLSLSIRFVEGLTGGARPR